MLAVSEFGFPCYLHRNIGSHSATAATVVWAVEAIGLQVTDWECSVRCARGGVGLVPHAPHPHLQNTRNRTILLSRPRPPRG